jgi:hypothetical protein
MQNPTMSLSFDKHTASLYGRRFRLSSLREGIRMRGSNRHDRGCGDRHLRDKCASQHATPCNVTDAGPSEMQCRSHYRPLRASGDEAIMYGGPSAHACIGPLETTVHRSRLLAVDLHFRLIIESGAERRYTREARAAMH